MADGAVRTDEPSCDVNQTDMQDLIWYHADVDGVFRTQ
jgi:hypothetical protein